MSWFADVLKEALERRRKYKDDYPELVIDVYLTDINELRDRPDFADGVVLDGGLVIHHGRPSADEVLERAAKKMRSLHIESALTIACGVSAMVSGFWDACVRQTIKKKSKVAFLFHHETFDCELNNVCL